MKQLQLDSLNRLSSEAFKAISKKPISLILDNVRSMHNVGAAFRIADAFLIEKIYLCGITGKPPHREITKTALGAEETVEWIYSPTTEAVLQKLKEKQYLLIAVEQTDESISLSHYQPEMGQRYALVFGNEVFGITQTSLAECDLALEIPQYGTKHSLNVAVAMGIVAWKFITSMEGS